MSGRRRRDTQAGGDLMGFVRQAETHEAIRRQADRDLRATLKAAKAAGYDLELVAALVKARRKGEALSERSLVDAYLAAIGIGDAPLFASAGLLTVDAATRARLAEACAALVPPGREMILRVGDGAVRLFFDESGRPQAEDFVGAAVVPLRRRG